MPLNASEGEHRSAPRLREVHTRPEILRRAARPVRFRHFVRKLLGHTGGELPERITTDELGSYAATKRRILEPEGVEHLQVRSRRQCNNRVEQAHQPTRIRERRMGRFRCPASARRLLSAFARVLNLLRPRRHLLSVSTYHSALERSFAIRREAIVSVAV